MDFETIAAFQFLLFERRLSFLDRTLSIQWHGLVVVLIHELTDIDTG